MIRLRVQARANEEIRSIEIKQNIVSSALGSVEIKLGDTWVVCVIKSSHQQQVQTTIETDFMTDWIKRLWQDEPVEVTLTVLENNGDAKAMMLLALHLATQQAFLAQQKELPSLVALNAGKVDGEYVVDLTLEEEKKATAILFLAQSADQIAEMTVTGECSIDDFNDLLAILTKHIDRVQNALPIPVKPVVTNDKTIVIVTKNPAKAKEFKAMFSGYQVKTLLDFPELPDVEETGKTFLENASLKAHTISQLLNCPVLGDDSGLCVDALGGMPGIYSARFAGDHNTAANNAKLLSEMAGIPEMERTAHYHTTLVFAAPGKEDLVVEGEVEGLIAGIPRGENGFGYDPLFYLPELDKTMAEITPEQKNKLSHRAVATAKLKQVWRQWLEG